MDWTAEDWCKVILSVEAPLLEHLGKLLSSKEKVNHIVSTGKHPETSHMWCWFSSRGVGFRTILPQNTTRNTVSKCPARETSTNDPGAIL